MIVQMRMFGRGDAERVAVAVEDDDCAHCLFVRDNVRMRTGEIALVVNEESGEIRRVECVGRPFRMLALKCERVTEADARELAEQ